MGTGCIGEPGADVPHARPGTLPAPSFLMWGCVVRLSLVNFGAVSPPPHPMQAGCTALHFAAMAGQLPAVRFLVRQNADLNAQDQVRGSCLCWGFPFPIELVVGRSTNRWACGPVWGNGGTFPCPAQPIRIPHAHIRVQVCRVQLVGSGLRGWCVDGCLVAAVGPVSSG
jgi:hypothetical protein